MQIRLLPIIIGACSILLMLKVADLVERRQTIVEAFIISPLSAQEEDTEGGEETSEGGGDDGGEDSETPEEDVTEFTPTEVDILQRLSRRREKLEEWQADLEVKENILNITQTKIDQKIVELRTLKQQVESVLAQYNQREDEKTMTLVKIYENMKPKDAAKIFSEMDTETLLEVVDKMKEAKLALILAQMDPKRAKEVTVRFAERGRLPEP